MLTLQYCDGFCHTLTWISHRCTKHILIKGNVCVQSQARLRCARKVCLFFLYIWLHLSVVSILPSGRNLSPVISEFLPLSLETTACWGVQDTSGTVWSLVASQGIPILSPSLADGFWVSFQCAENIYYLVSYRKILSISDLEGFLHKFYLWYLCPGP